MLEECFSTEEILCAEQLIELVNPDAGEARAQVVELRERLNENSDEDDGYDEDDAESIFWLLNEFITGYFVDWKDTEDFVGTVVGLASEWGVSLTFGVDDPLDEEFLSKVRIPELMKMAHAELREHGLTLWNWDTGADCYAGWITKSTACGVVEAISKVTGTDIRAGDSPF